MSISSIKTEQTSTVVVTYRLREHPLERRLLDIKSRYLNTYKALHLGGKETPESNLIRFTATVCPTHSDSEMASRIDNYHTVSEHLNNLKDAEFSAFLKTASSKGRGTGGEGFFAEVADMPVFIKKIPLTATEQKHPKSTVNLFQLPPYYQYGVGSMGFGVWRELSSHEMTTEWVLNGECQNFPLMYHWKVLEREVLPPELTAEESEKRKMDIAYWDGSSAVGLRAKSIDEASADVVIVMERFPQPLYKWLDGQGNLSEEKIIKLEQEMNLVVAFMKSRGFIHFDAHAANILSNSDHIYFADFGLSISQEFDLSPAEETFFQQHRDYDRYYVILHLASNTIAAALGDEKGRVAWDTYLETGKITAILPTQVASIAEKYRPIVILMDKFFHGLQEKSKSTPYPVAELAREWSLLSSNEVMSNADMV